MEGGYRSLNKTRANPDTQVHILIHSRSLKEGIAMATKIQVAAGVSFAFRMHDFCNA
jgi:hypothetical protein